MADKDDKPVDALSDTTMSDTDTLVEGGASKRLVTPFSTSLSVDRYELITELGSGGMGSVWLGVDKLLSRDVAIKILHKRHTASDDVKSRFEREARLTGRLDHPGIVPVHDVGVLPTGEHFFAMQRIQGVDLRQHLDSILNRYNEPTQDTIHEYPLQALLRLFNQVCLIIAYAHDRGYIHRDLKPANILVGTFGELYVADWGIAKVNNAIADVAEEHVSVLRPDDYTDESRPGVLIGTVQYMSPEQVTPETHEVTQKSDIFSLGIVLHELLTGEAPFTGKSFLSVMRKIVEGDRTKLNHMPDGRPVPAALAALLDSMMATDSDDRPTAKQVAERIDRYLDGVEDRLRSAQRAAEYLAEGRAQLAMYREQKASAAQTVEALERQEAELRNEIISADDVASGSALDPYVSVWKARRDLYQAGLETQHIYTRAVRALNRSIDYQDNVTSHKLLADLYWDKYVDATDARDRETAVFFKALVLEHDQGKYEGLLGDTGRLDLKVQSVGDSAHPVEGPLGQRFDFSFEKYVEAGPLLIPESVQLEANFCDVGSYRLSISRDSNHVIHVPFVIRSNELTELRVELPEEDMPGFVFIAGGKAELGGDEDAPLGLDPAVFDVPSFWMGKNPITVGEYVDFLNDLAKTDVTGARSHAPRSPAGMVYIDYNEQKGAFEIPSADKDGHRWDSLWPITMVTQIDALAYCAWRSGRDGIDFRLPTEFEWEYAARGADKRAYPWGNGYDRLLSCSSRGMTDDKTMSGAREGPGRIDEFPYDVSPFGVRHMGGLAMEWTSTVNYAGNIILRGGGLFSMAAYCRAASRSAHAPSHLAVQFGFRLAVTA